MMLKRFGIGLLRLLIGIAFTFSLAIGITLTLLTLCDGSGSNLTLARTGPHWEWSVAALVALTFMLVFWLCWRRLPPVQPAAMFPALQRRLQAPAFWVGMALLTGLTAVAALFTIEMGMKMVAHAAGTSWRQFWQGLLWFATYGSWTVIAWKQRQKKKSEKAYSQR